MANEFVKVTDQNGVDHPVKDLAAFPRSEQALLGARNWLNIPKGTYTQYDITFVVDDTGITLNGTCNATSGTKVNVTNVPISIDAKVADYKGVDVADNMSDDCYIWMNSPFSGGNINGKSWTISTATKVIGYISVKGGVTYNNLKIQPMITLASDTDPTYSPFAMNNRELTDKVFEKRKLENGDDLNEIIETGVYYLRGNNVSNIPPDITYSSLYAPIVVLRNDSTADIRQIIYRHDGTKYMRAKTGSPAAWTSWYKFTGTIVS